MPLEPDTGFEPATRCLQNSRSAVELVRHARAAVKQRGVKEILIYIRRIVTYYIGCVRVHCTEAMLFGAVGARYMPVAETYWRLALTIRINPPFC